MGRRGGEGRGGGEEKREEGREGVGVRGRGGEVIG